MLIELHIRVRRGDFVDREGAVDRKPDAARFEKRQQVARARLDAFEPFLLRARAERHANQLQALEPKLAQIDLSRGRTETRDIDEPPLDREAVHVGLEYRAADRVDDHVD